MQNVSWAQAFDQCTQNIESGRLYNKLSTFNTHLQHDRSVLRQNGWQNIDIWFGIMSSDNSTWLSAEQNECVDDLTGRVKDTLPPLTPGFSQCMLLNMSGFHDTDIHYAASCDELHPFMCQSQVSIGSVEVTLYSEMKIKLDYFDSSPKVKTIWSYNLDECQDQMSNQHRAFAGVYYPATGDCELYLHNPPLMYPVRVQMENHTNVMSIVKSKGHEGK
ncbi:unnamed protein product [Mytilus edulis]|uniref:C-type lectin domain-containing protein n=1 Tax=Mytilus edulis TaxID=6550 RepID=A0A8S3SZ09_MYTED|nr:unnamed protein product [Mytilus edulis]